jgi:N-acetylmuramoyl-L-alanine amidase
LKRSLFIKLVLAAAFTLWLSPPVCTASEEFEVQDRTSGRIDKLAIHEARTGSYLDLRELSALVGGGLRWKIPAERITWTLDGVSLSFEDRLGFFTSGEKHYQLVECCFLDGGRFLVPLQLAVEYLPGFFPSRFSFNKLENRLVDRTGRQAVAKAGTGKPGTRAQSLKKASSNSKDADLSNYRINTVVIDPGHGGKDPGALGRRYKLEEKDIVLDISKKVAAWLKKNSKLKVLLTRNSDKYIYPPHRGQMANKNNAGLFVSIHVNASKKKSVRGTSTFFLDEAKTDEDRATAMLENASLKYEIDQVDAERLDEVNLILQDMAQNEFLRESYELSTYIHQQLVKRLGIPAWGRGVRQANFAVLRGAFMPAALVEIAFISNAQEEKLLRTKKFREKAAEAISRGILVYIEQYHRKLVSGK